MKHQRQNKKCEDKSKEITKKTKTKVQNTDKKENKPKNMYKIENTNFKK